MSDGRQRWKPEKGCRIRYYEDLGRNERDVVTQIHETAELLYRVNFPDGQGYRRRQRTRYQRLLHGKTAAVITHAFAFEGGAPVGDFDQPFDQVAREHLSVQRAFSKNALSTETVTLLGRPDVSGMDESRWVSVESCRTHTIRRELLLPMDTCGFDSETCISFIQDHSRDPLRNELGRLCGRLAKASSRILL